MYRKIAIALIVVGSFVIGYAGFSGSTAQASHNCSTDSAILAANPELTAACQHVVAVSNPATAQLPTFNVTTTNSAVLASNPELSIVGRYNAANYSAADKIMIAQENWHRDHFPGR
jgi:hypothetical protein